MLNLVDSAMVSRLDDSNAALAAVGIGGFMLLQNTSDKPVSVVAVHGNVSKTIELHRTIFSEGMARMVPQPKLEVPANGELVLKPGDYHVMFIRPKALRVGDKVDLELELDDGSRVPLTAEVRPRPRGMKGHNHH